MRRLNVVGFVALAALVATGCSSFEPKPVETPLSGPKIISNTASIRNTYVMERDSPLLICAEPPPDAAFAQDTDMDIAVSLIATGGDKGGDDDEGSSEAEMAGRSPTVLLARELFYRLCEFSRNYQVDRPTAIELYKMNLDIVREIGSKQADRTTITVGDTVSNDDSVAVDQRPADGRKARQRDGRDRNRRTSPYDPNGYSTPYDPNTYSTPYSRPTDPNSDY